MKSIIINEYGGYEQLQIADLEKPVPTREQLLVRVKAIGVNFADTRRRIGSYIESAPLPFIPGMEVSGVVEQVGSNISNFKPGDRVVSIINEGGYSEYVTVHENQVTPIPDDVNFESAAAIPLQGITAYQMLRNLVTVKNNDTVLIHAAAGGVGTLSIQLAKIFGAKQVIATASSEKKLEVTKIFGSDYQINYKDPNWISTIKEITNNEGANIILESIGGEVFHKSLECLADFGHMIVFGRSSGLETLFDPRQLMLKNQTIKGFYYKGNYRDHKKIMEIMLKYLQNKKIQVQIGGVFPLEEARRAHELLETGKSVGKLLLVNFDN